MKNIKSWITHISKSKLPVRQFFDSHKIPFSVAQYYRYKKTMLTDNVILDKRKSGNNKKLTNEAELFLMGYLNANKTPIFSDIQDLLQEHFSIEITKSGISRCIKRLGYSVVENDPNQILNHHYTTCGGLHIISALANHLGWGKFISSLITNKMDDMQNSEQWDSIEKDTYGRNRKGQFTVKYNKRKDIRQNRFLTIDIKRESKRFNGMSLAKSSTAVIERKSIATMVLPVVTSNGALRTVNTPVGNALEDLCGYNYKQDTLNKFLTEIKYLSISSELLKEQAFFWQKIWKNKKIKLSSPIVCYYVDGNTKPLWSKQHFKKSKVTMIGRVMGCLEQVFVHDNFGRPIYFETFSGQAPNGEYVLELFDKIENELNESYIGNTQVSRAIVIDGASNSVKTLRAFASQKKYHYITTLDDNQWNSRKIRKMGRPQRYRHGNATLRECEIELIDSIDKGYIHVVRAIKIDWDYGKVTVLLTSLDEDIINASIVVKSYFERWPYQELMFKKMKAGASLNRVAGYGRILIDNENVKEKQDKLKLQIKSLRKNINGILNDISFVDKEVDILVREEQKMKSKSVIKNGKRIMPKKYSDILIDIGKKIENKKNEIKKIISKNENGYNKLQNLEKKWLRLQGKEKVYKIDVELDQIMTSFRISFVNLCSYFVMEFLNGLGISLSHLIQKIFMMPALIIEMTDTMQIQLDYNNKDPMLMEALSSALKKLNLLKIKDENEKTLYFALENIDSHLKSTRC
ncbi:MAG TPA: hypothetical protein VNG53_04650 [Bacteroidia bacterium]|nr:hypothetical protein [Bacteroidia bacterium]